MELVFPRPLEPLFHKPKHIRHILIEGGRGGGKSHTVAEFLLIEALRAKKRILCAREIQKSISESVHHLLNEKINIRKYPYTVYANAFRGNNASDFSFCGVRDHTVSSIKSYEGVDIFWGEESQTFTKKSLDIVIPTIRKEGSYFIWTMNRFDDADPILEYMAGRDDVMFIKVNYPENPHCTEEIRKEAELCKKKNYDDYLHIWMGEAVKQGDNSIIRRDYVDQAMKRNVEPEGKVFIGVDVARFGDDTTVIYKRKGLKVIQAKEMQKKDTVVVANEASAMGDLEATYNVDDTGVGGGVSDNLVHKGHMVNMVNNGGVPMDKDKYPNVISEMWFMFADLLESQEIEIPDDRELMQQLTMRRYKFDTKGRRCVESKDDFKKRYGHSPDKADALLLCFYQNVGSIDFMFL